LLGKLRYWQKNNPLVNKGLEKNWEWILEKRLVPQLISGPTVLGQILGRQPLMIIISQDTLNV